MKLKQLEEMGFSREDCEKALTECKGALEDAAIWLTKNASPVVEKSTKKSQQGLEVAVIEVLYNYYEIDCLL